MCKFCKDKKFFTGVNPDTGHVGPLPCPVCVPRPSDRPTCMMCSTPTPATHQAGDWDVCAGHYNAITAPVRPLCAECGQPLGEEDLAAGADLCLECEGLALITEIEMDNPLLATVRVRLEALS